MHVVPTSPCVRCVASRYSSAASQDAFLLNFAAVDAHYLFLDLADAGAGANAEGTARKTLRRTQRSQLFRSVPAIFTVANGVRHMGT